jgi:1-phosphofructokinase
MTFDVVAVTLNPTIDYTGGVSHFTTGQVNRVASVRSNPGGKGLNAAMALADYGLKVAVTGFLGKENRGVFEPLLLQKEIRDHFIRVPGQTRLAIKIIDDVRQETTDINFPGPVVGSMDLGDLQQHLDSLKASWYLFGGSLPPGVPDTIYRDLILKLKKRGKNVVLDSSGEPLRLGIEAAPDIIKPNWPEIEMLVGEKLPDISAVLQAARSLLSRGIQLVVVSMGAEGACFVTADKTIIAQPPQIVVHSTVGAGDAMVAGVVASRIAGSSLEDTARRATAFSINVLSHESPGLSSANALRATIPQVILKTIS